MTASKACRKRPGEIWPQAIVRQCVTHLVRSSLRYASKAHWSRLTRDLRQIYTAPTEAAAQQRFTEFEAEWGDRYPAIVRLWRDAWPTFTPFLAFPAEIRKVIYIAKAIESLNARFRQATRRCGHFPTEQAALKVLYLVIRQPLKNRPNVTGKTPRLEGRAERPGAALRWPHHPELKADHRLAHRLSDTPRTVGGPVPVPGAGRAGGDGDADQAGCGRPLSWAVKRLLHCVLLMCGAVLGDARWGRAVSHGLASVFGVAWSSS